MTVIKCKMCGGNLETTEGASVAECEYCGTKQTVPIADNQKKLTLFSRANRLRLSNEFDKAASVYESIVADFPEEAEAYWGLVLCRYGIEYVDDPATGRKIPTCHRSSFDNVLDDPNFEQTLENADVIARRVYREEAKAMEELRRGIIAVSSKEEPYDIFICYKETDENGNRTLDSVLAQDIYDALVEKGYRVFFARVSLEDKIGQEYEPYIFAALNSSKVMLVVGTDYEYFNSVWVKNEWSRFLKLITSGQKKTLIPCFKGVDAYDLPKEFAKLQAQDLGKLGAMQDLMRGIDKVISNDIIAHKTHSIEFQMQMHVISQADNLVKLGILELNSGETEKGIRQFEEALQINSNHVGAFLGLVRATDSIKSQPYCNRLYSFSTEEVMTWLKANKEMLDNTHLPLIDSIIRNTGSYELTKAVIDSGANPDGNYAMYYAIQQKDCLNLVNLLFGRGANLNREYNITFNTGKETHSPLSHAIWVTKNTELINFLVENGADVNYYGKVSTGESWSVLDLAVRVNSLPIVKTLLEHGADPNSGRYFCGGYLSDFKYTYFCALSEAIWNVKNPDIVKELIQRGANCNYKYTYFFTGSKHLINACGERSSLFDAICYSSDTEMLCILIEAGANPSQNYEYKFISEGYTITVPILAVAAYCQKKEAIDVLLKAGASFDELCYEKKDFDSDECSAPLKKCNFRFSDEMKNFLFSRGWKGPSFFKGFDTFFRC